VTTAGGAAVGAVLAGSGVRAGAQPKRRYAIVGTGVRGIGMWGRPIVKQYGAARYGCTSPRTTST
jgi:hypothetical protein